MLKQSAFFDKLEKKKLSAVQYYTLYRLAKKPELSEDQKKKIRTLVPSAYINLGTCRLSDKGESLVKEIDMLFKPMKKLTSIDLLGPDYSNRIQEFIEIFPTQKLPSGKYARGNKKNVETNLIWFFTEFDYDWDTIMKATEKYVVEYHRKNYEYMRTAMYFIKKLVDGTPQSELANYCDIILSGDDYIEERHHKTRVV